MESLQPKLRFKEFKEPWNKLPIKEVLTIGSGRDYKNLGMGNVPVYGTGGIMTYVDDFLYDGETVCIGRKGTIDKPMYFEGKIWTVDTLFYTHKFTNSIPKFIFYTFQNINWKEHNEASGVPSLSKSTIEKITITLPSESEQTKIANFLSAVDEKINLLKDKKSLLEDYKKGIMQKIFNQELRFKDDNGNDFEEWKVKRLKDFMVERNIQLPKNDKYPLMSFVANKGVTDKGARYNREFLVNDEENKKYKQTEYGDFIYSSNNLETGSIGLNNYGSASISPVYSIFKINELFDYKFISNFFSRKEFISKMTKFRQGVMYGQWRIHEKDFLQIEENFPCLKEQTKIANFLSSIDEKIDLVSTQIEETQEYKKGLLQQMFI